MCVAWKDASGNPVYWPYMQTAETENRWVDLSTGNPVPVSTHEGGNTFQWDQVLFQGSHVRSVGPASIADSNTKSSREEEGGRDSDGPHHHLS